MQIVVKVLKDAREVLHRQSHLQGGSNANYIKMYVALEALPGCALAPPVYQEGLCAPERHLFYLAIETITHAQRKNKRDVKLLGSAVEATNY